MLPEVASALARRRIRCVVVGGVAIAAHGVSRGTQDLDFAVASADGDSAVETLESLGYETVRRTAGFSNHLRGRTERVDLLYVEGATAEAIFDRAAPQSLFDSEPVLVVHPEHLVAMKLFALKQNPARVGIDLEDVRALLLRGAVDATTVRRYLDRYELERFREALGLDD